MPSHTRHAKPNHAAWPLFIWQNVTKQYKKAIGYTHYKPKHLKRAIIWPHKGHTTKKKRVTTGINAKNLQAYNGWVGGRSGSKNGNKKTEKLQRIMWPRSPAHTSTQTLRCVWEKFFPLHSFLSQWRPRKFQRGGGCMVDLIVSRGHLIQYRFQRSFLTY